MVGDTVGEVRVKWRRLPPKLSDPCCVDKHAVRASADRDRGFICILRYIVLVPDYLVPDYQSCLEQPTLNSRIHLMTLRTAAFVQL